MTHSLDAWPCSEEVCTTLYGALSSNQLCIALECCLLNHARYFAGQTYYFAVAPFCCAAVALGVFVIPLQAAVSFEKYVRLLPCHLRGNRTQLLVQPKDKLTKNRIRTPVGEALAN